MRWAAIDFETANEQRGSACAIGVAFVDDGQITDTDSWLIRPQVPVFNPFNVAIHGISASDVVDAPEFDSVWRELWPRLQGRIILAHFAAFDTSVLRASFDAYGMQYPEFDYFCTHLLSKQVWSGLLDYSLPSVAEHVGFDFEHHDPEEDAVAAAKVGLAALKEIGVESIGDAEVRLNRYLLKEFGAVKQRYGQIHGAWKSPSSFAPTVDEIDEENLFFGTSVVITGTLESFTRAEAIQEIVNRGARVSGSVSKKTDVLVVGEQDLRRFRGGDMSAKMRRARELATDGIDIELISEDEFVRRLFVSRLT